MAEYIKNKYSVSEAAVPRTEWTEGKFKDMRLEVEKEGTEQVELVE